YLGTTIKVRFRGTTGSSWRSDMAIDNINVGSTVFTSAPLSNASPIADLSDDELSIKMYPNPVVDQLQIELKGYGVGNYSIISSNGQVVREGQIDGKAEVDMSPLSSGYYIINIDHDEGTIREKIMKK
ncbi:MAG: T9SS type A sorting domain-containing protein, partial [Bacteroidota bacterium]